MKVILMIILTKISHNLKPTRTKINYSHTKTPFKLIALLTFSIDQI